MPRKEASAISDRSPQFWGRTPSRSDPPLPFIGLIRQFLRWYEGCRKLLNGSAHDGPGGTRGGFAVRGVACFLTTDG